jgi:hypothetical protein
MFKVWSYFTFQPVSVSSCRAPLWDLRPDITSCRKVAVWNLRSCFCGTPSLMRGRVCNLQCNHSMVRVAQNPWTYFTVSSDTSRFEVTLWQRLLYDWQSVSMSWYRAPLWDLRPDITSCRNVAAWNFRSYIYGAPSLTKRTGLQFAVQSLNGPSRLEPVTILYCLIWDSPSLKGQVLVFISPRNSVAQLYPRALGKRQGKTVDKLEFPMHGDCSPVSLWLGFTYAAVVLRPF